MHSWGQRAAHRVSTAITPRPPSQSAAVIGLRFGAGHVLQPRRRAIAGPNLASISGHRSSPSTSARGTRIEVMRAGPSFTNWNRERKYHSGRGTALARGSAACPSWSSGCPTSANRPSVIRVAMARIAYGHTWSGK